mmetsp:Transcript_22363/g.33041  ORF Transcript_22363/g.33041 Transcript_22363/m.33041 type:complete len:133 (-) Transcript_22363:124-522(-)
MNNNLAPVSVNDDEIPSGFTAANPGASAQGQQNEDQQRQAQKEAVLEQALTPEALARLRRIKLVKKDKAVAVENLIASMALQRKLPGVINEGRLIEMLEGLGAKEASSNNKISFQRKRYAFDSDDEDDDDLM